MATLADSLHRLQEAHLRLQGLRGEIAARYRSAERARRQVERLEEQIAGVRADLRERQMAADRMDLNLKAREAEVNKLRASLNRAKTNKEYSAILTQLNTTKADNSKLEEQLLALMEEIDGIRSRLAELESRREALVAEARAAEEAARQFEEQSSGRLKELEAERAAAAAEVDPETLALFDRIATKHEGEAMAAVTQPNPRVEEFYCEGCSMTVTLEQISMLRTGRELVTCNVCGRILYLESPAR